MYYTGNKLTTNNSRAVWKEITNYKKEPTSPPDEDPSLPDKLSDFYARFEDAQTPAIIPLLPPSLTPL